MTVKGKTRPKEHVTLELMQNQKVIDTAVVLADSKGDFVYTFKSLADGNYFVNVVAGWGSHGLPFSIDTKVPGKVSGIQFSRENGGLKATWSAPPNAVSYKVEVAENDGPFKEIASVGTSVFIPVIQEGTTYRVRVTAYSQTGKASVSDIASYKVSPTGGSDGSVGNNPPSGNIGGGVSTPSKPTTPEEPKKEDSSNEDEVLENTILSQLTDNTKKGDNSNP